jgi:hypothetical protein
VRLLCAADDERPCTSNCIGWVGRLVGHVSPGGMHLLASMACLSAGLCLALPTLDTCLMQLHHGTCPTKKNGLLC